MTISLRRANEFWEIVLDCLVELFEVPEREAQRRVSYVFHQIASLKLGSNDPEWLSELIYHAEEVSAAADLAGKEMPVGEAFRARYDEIIVRHLKAGHAAKVVAADGKLVKQGRSEWIEYVEQGKQQLVEAAATAAAVYPGSAK